MKDIFERDMAGEPVSIDEPEYYKINEQIIKALPTLGVEALLLSVAGTLGCCVLAWALWKIAGGKR